MNDIGSQDTQFSFSAAQFRMARACLGWSVAAAAKASGVSISTIKRIESPDTFRKVQISNVADLMAVYSNDGVRFLTPGEQATDPGITYNPIQREFEFSE